jgi:predicted nucleic-acid-binding Zn-ribbon protein
MKSGKCPKCGSSNVRKSKKPGKWDSDKGMVPLGGAFDSNLKVQHFVCVGCGYVEVYVTDPKGIEKMRKKWKLATEND